MANDNKYLRDTLSKSAFDVLEEARQLSQGPQHYVPVHAQSLPPGYCGRALLWYLTDGTLLGVGNGRPRRATCLLDELDLRTVLLCIDRDGLTTLPATMYLHKSTGDAIPIGSGIQAERVNRYEEVPSESYLLRNVIFPQIHDYRHMRELEKAGGKVSQPPWHMTIAPDDLAQRVKEMEDERKAAQIGAQAFDAVEKHQRDIHNAHEARKQAQYGAAQQGQGNSQCGQAGNQQYVPGNNSHVGHNEPVPSPSPTILDGMSTLWAGIVNYVKRFYKGK